MVNRSDAPGMCVGEEGDLMALYEVVACEGVFNKKIVGVYLTTESRATAIQYCAHLVRNGLNAIWRETLPMPDILT